VNADRENILHYFIEEARDHLKILEQGLEQLGRSSFDAETVNQLFRSAHTIKGGAAMMGLSAVQQVSHRLEDCFKQFQGNEQPLTEITEPLFLQLVDQVSTLIDQVEAGENPDADAVMQLLDPTFATLQQALGSAPPSAERPLVEPDQGLALLRRLLQLLRGEDSATCRTELLRCCDALQCLTAHERWCELMETSRVVLSRDDLSLLEMAVVVIPALKQGLDYLHLERLDHLRVSPSLSLSAQPAAVVLPVLEEPVQLVRQLRRYYSPEQLMRLAQALSPGLPQSVASSGLPELAL
jgi:chemotaxis protein histidine kinase CheA